MKFFKQRFFNVPDAGGAGGAPAAPAQPSVAAVPPAGDANPPSSAAGTPPAAASDPAAGGGYRPEGLAEQYLGKTDAETIDKLRAAVDGYRNRDSQNHVPDRVEAYSAFPDDVPDTVKPHLDVLKADPIFARLNEKALALRVPAPVYQGLVQEFISVSSELGMMEPVVDAAAERAALVPDTARHLTPTEQTAAVNRRMDENYAFLDGMVARGAQGGGLGKDDAEFAKAMLGDSAKGHRFLEWMRGQFGGQGGGGPAMHLPGTSAGSDPKADLLRRQALPENTFGHRDFNRASYDAFMADWRKFYGT